LELEAAGPQPAASPLVHIGGHPRRHFLFVSAPFGPFSRELADALEGCGARCSRVILNGGDLLDWRRRGGLIYLGGAAAWPSWLSRVILRNGVTDILTYGDCRPLAAAALELARELRIRTHVLEQGYFRPDWITLERGGVNANSHLPAHPDWYHARAAGMPERPPQAVGRAMPSAVLWMVLHHLAIYAGKPVFLRFKNGYSRSAASQAVGHSIRFVFRDALVRGHGQRRARLMNTPGPLFLLLLQRPGDSQLLSHSKFRTSRDFLDSVVSSFAAHAPAEAHLMVRPHPLDPGLEPHERSLERIARREGVSDRVAFVDDGKLHEILPRIDGAVCVNSTAGLAAIEFGRPTVVLGRAIYDMPGLTHQSGLDRFWREPEAPSAEFYAAFRKVVMATTQVNGAFATPRGRALAVPAVVRRLLDSRRPEAVLGEAAEAEEPAHLLKMIAPRW
jgi:capsular polysaccharide export protein